MLEDPSLITAGSDPTSKVALGAVLEILLIIANVGTAVVFFPILRRLSEAGAIGYVGARIVECIFIAIGLIAMLTFVLMWQEGTGTADSGETLVAIYYRAFLVGPGFFAGFGNGLLLGWLPIRPRPEGDGDPRADRWSARDGIGGRGHARRGRARWGPPDHRDDPGVLLGEVPRHLPRRQGVEADSHHRWTGVIGDSSNSLIPPTQGVSDGPRLRPGPIAMAGSGPRNASEPRATHALSRLDRIGVGGRGFNATVSSLPSFTLPSVASRSAVGAARDRFILLIGATFSWGVFITSALVGASFMTAKPVRMLIVVSLVSCVAAGLAVDMLSGLSPSPAS